MSPPNVESAQGGTVSQSEIERLLAQMGSGDLPAPDAAPAASQGPSRGDFVQRHEFPKLSQFSADELRRLRVRHEEFISSLAAQLSIHLGMEVAVQMSKFETLPYQAFVEGLSSPTHLVVSKLKPLAGNCVLEIPGRLALCFVDRELGGLGTWPDEPRELTRMETGLLGRVVEIMLSEWCGNWGDLLDLRPVTLRCENNGRALQTSPPNTMLLVLGMEIRMGGVVEQAQLGVPAAMLEPLVAKLNAQLESEQEPVAASSQRSRQWNPALDDLAMRLTVELPELEITLGDLSNLKLGDVIPFRAEPAKPARVSVEGTPKFNVVLGTSGQQFAVQIAEVLKG